MWNKMVYDLSDKTYLQRAYLYIIFIIGIHTRAVFI